VSAKGPLIPGSCLRGRLAHADTSGHETTHVAARLTAQGWCGLGLLSAATLLYEINLTRLYSVAQFYHFAFMIISLAMLGFGASGTLLAIAPRLGRKASLTVLGTLATGFGVTGVGAYALMNLVPFDSFALVVQRQQIGILAAHYVALSLPFLCSGAVVGMLFRDAGERTGAVYAANLGGSAIGCGLALLVPVAVGGEGAVLVSAALGLAAGALLGWPNRCLSGGGALVAVACLLGALRVPAPLQLRLSPYKGLSYALQYPGARVEAQRWNGFSRVDLVSSAGVRSLPGLSYRYEGEMPVQHALFVDGDDLSGVLTAAVEGLGFTDYLPGAVAYRLVPGAEALVLQPRGGLDVWLALGQGAARVTAVEPNPLVVDMASRPYEHTDVRTVVDDPRSYVRRSTERYGIVVLSLTSGYRPVRSGAYSLGEDYHLTVEAVGEYLAHLAPDGVFVLTRWLQTPPSESVRAWALLVEALEAAGGDPGTQLVAMRGYSTMTMLARAAPFGDGELAAVRRFAEERAFDLVYAPGMREEEANRFSILPEPVYYRTFHEVLAAQDRASWYARYPYDVRPPTDDRPFFAHYFRWAQMPRLLAELGKTWEPFGGAGYMVLLILAVLALGAAGVLILLPAAVRARASLARPRAPSHTGAMGGRRLVAYFGLLGLAYLFVEIALIQRFVLFLGQPAYALTAVLFSVLAFSALGSGLSARMRPRWVLGPLVLIVLSYPVALPLLFNAALGLPLALRLLITLVAIAPLGTLMGMPFPLGLRALRGMAPDAVPWAWGVNGATSVVASVLATLIALDLGYSAVLLAGALCYAGAWLAAPQKVSDAPGEAVSMPGPVKGTNITPPRL